MKLNSVPSWLVATWLLGAESGAGAISIGYGVGSGNGVTYVHQVTDHAFRAALGRFDLLTVGGSGRILYVDNEEKTYREHEAADMEGSRARARGTKRPHWTGKEVSLAFGGQTMMIVGYEAERYDLSLGSDTLEVWMAPALNRPAHYLDSWRTCQLSPSPYADFAEKAVAALESIDGMPLLLRWNTRVMGQSMRTEIRALDIKVTDLPASTFQPPAGYAKVDAKARPKDTKLPPEAVPAAK